MIGTLVIEGLINKKKITDDSIRYESHSRLQHCIRFTTP